MGYAVQKAEPIMGTWVPTFAGFSADPTMTCRYILIGKMCHFWVTTSGHGTSNSTTASGKTMTLPFTAYNGISQSVTIAGITDAGTAQTATGRGIIGSNSNVMTIYRNAAISTAWTASGNCSWNLSGSYEIA